MYSDTLISDDRPEIAAPEEQQSVTALAWRVSFTEGAKKESPDTVAIKKPRNLTAILTPIDMQEAWEERYPVTGHSLILVWAPPGAYGPFGVEGNLDERTLVRAGIRAVRVAWDGARAVICCADDHLRDAIDAVLRFSTVEWETTDIERLLASNRPVVEEDAALTHSIRRGQLRRQKRVDALTESCVHLKMRYLRTYRSLEQLDPTLPEPSQRLYSELVLAARLHDRLELLDQPIQFMLDQCEIANTRLIETKNARMERRNSLMEHVLGLTIILVIFLLYYPPDLLDTDQDLLAPATEETAEKGTSEKATAAPEAETSKATAARGRAGKIGVVAPSKAAPAGRPAKHVAAEAAGGKKLAIRPPRSHPAQTLAAAVGGARVSPGISRETSRRRNP